jgi:DNA mismatch repair protein MutL
VANIFLLDEFTVSQIAAGEVVERPVSVVKELVENSLDAGANRIIVNLWEGGTAGIEVCDNGSGMDEKDAVLAFQRHATSKIKSSTDLGRVITMGFRGEALPSIAAVSRVTLKTRPPEFVGGTQVEVQGGEIKEVRPAGCPAGTAVTVHDLFYNTPARRKQLKSAATESGLISDLVARFALTRPAVSFELTLQGRKAFYTPGSGELIDAAVTVFGADMVREMLPFEGSEGTLKVEGYVSKPSLSRSSRRYQTIIINGRYVRCPAISKTIEDIYRPFLSAGRWPVTVLALTIDPFFLDVNIHPAKLEVKLQEEEKVTGLINRVLHEVLHNRSVIPVIRPGRPVKEEADIRQPALNLTAASSQLEKEELLVYGQVDSKNCSVADAGIEAEINRNQPKLPELTPLAQLFPTYILAEGEEGLYIIDQHAAHERVLFEQYNTSAKKDNGGSQILLYPVTLELGYREVQLLNKYIFQLTEAGFVLEHFGGNTFLLRGIPSYLPSGQERQLFLDLIESLEGQEQAAFPQRLAAAMACRHAVKAGEKLGMPKMKALLEQLAETENPYICPHGRPTITHITFHDLSTKFKRG